MANKDKNELLQRAYDLSGPEEAQALYRDWATTYDETMVGELSYIAHQKIARMLAEHLSGAEKTGYIADIGCGTGLTGQAAFDFGLTNLAGLDFSDEMLSVAAKRNIYKELLNVDLRGNLEIDSNRFDHAVSSGIFTHGHLDASCLAEIFRIIRPGGLFACVVRKQVWEEMGFASTFADMENSGKIKRIEEVMAGNYETSTETNGFCLVFKKLK